MFGTLFNAGMIVMGCLIGGILIFSSGLSIMGIKKFKSMNLLPALLVPPVFFAAKHVLGL
ncbi:DUF554 family protein [Saccharibacillus sacchari]|uniref:DUF554 family protein n=1 Tax=Saccharibacillus sacchari TaxID=456493 RepID=UPI0004B10EFD|nr:DUF554 family protein [Saccharibacillus sacchari]